MGKDQQLLETGGQNIQDDDAAIDRYIYKDIWRIPNSGVNKKWIRILVTDLAINKQRMIALGSKGCFATIQSFNRPEHEDNEPCICPLYFDLDSENFQEAYNDCIKLKQYFYEECNLEEGDAMEFFFSGNRGFHITASYKLFNAHPKYSMSHVIRFMAEFIAKKLELKTFDRSVYTKRRMWRMTNTLHGKSGLYKIQLYPAEIGVLKAGAIKDLAKTPREYENDI